MILAICLFCLSACLCAALCHGFAPLMRRYALAKPNARSLHAVPTPQGAGIAVLGSAFALFWLLCLTAGYPSFLTDAKTGFFLLTLTGTSALLALTGFVDDVRPLPAWPRLLIHGFAAALGVFSLPTLPLMPLFLPLAPFIPMPFSASLCALVLILGLIWFINLTNFMDGMDLMSVVTLAPLFLLLALLEWSSFPLPASVFLALSGALCGFVPFNWPVAKLFLGDVGSLPLGFLAGMGLVLLCAEEGLPTALIPALYYVSDATYTLVARLRRGEKIFEAHRSHFYQRALTKGWSVRGVIAHVLALNLLLAGMTFASLPKEAVSAGLPAVLQVFWPWLCLAVAMGMVMVVLRKLSRPYAQGQGMAMP